MRRPRAFQILGLDLSLTGSAGCRLPAGWDPTHPWDGVTWERFGAAGKLQGEERVQGIVEGVLRMVTPLTRHVYFEQYSFSKIQGKAFERAELVGAIKRELFVRHGFRMQPVVASAARKILLGPRRKRTSVEWKRTIAYELEMMGCPIDDGDSRDAFVVCNAARYQLGLSALASTSGGA